MTSPNEMAGRHDKGSQYAADHGLRGFWSSFLTGLSAVTLLSAPTFDPPRYPSDGVARHWRAVGDHMRNAIRRYDDLHKS